MSSLSGEAIQAAAKANGIHAAGWFRASDFAQYLESIRTNTEYHGFAYRPLEVFLGAGRLAAWIRSVVVLVMDYFIEPTDGPEGYRLSNYSRACWATVRPKTAALVGYLRGQGHRAEEVDLPHRAAACRAGLGFVGRNTMFYAHGLGSYVGIASIATDAEIQDAEVGRERLAHPACTGCGVCIASCPVSAIDPDGYRISPLRCISFANRHPDEPLRVLPSRKDLLRGWLHGCETCQDVCPLNVTVRHRHEAVLSPEIEIEGMRVPNGPVVPGSIADSRRVLATSPGYQRYLDRLIAPGEP